MDAPAPAQECQYCGETITERDMAAHYVHCRKVRYALDPSYNPLASEQYKARQRVRAANLAERKAVHSAAPNKGPGIVLNERSTRAYNTPRKQGRFIKVRSPNDNKEEHQEAQR